ncbi:hypothetical protein [Pelotomaculum schinkii]|nr:hypothetical protein [Pelotomaculum schinkii]
MNRMIPAAALQTLMAERLSTIKAVRFTGGSMDTYRIGDVTVQMECSGETLTKQAKPYRTEPLSPGDLPDINIDINSENLKSRKEKYPHLTLNEWEYVQTGFAFYRDILDYDGFGLHSSAVALENRAVLFSGSCGTGKSTHAGLWQQYFGKDKAVIVNDDKPVLRLVKGIFYAYGTPWSGKSTLNANIRVPLGAIVFLQQAKENHIRRLDSKEAIRMLVYQSLHPNNDLDKMNKLLTLIDALLQKTTVYQMDCNISLEAVKLAFDTINHERTEQR